MKKEMQKLGISKKAKENVWRRDSNRSQSMPKKKNSIDESQDEYDDDDDSLSENSSLGSVGQQNMVEKFVFNSSPLKSTLGFNSKHPGNFDSKSMHFNSNKQRKFSLGIFEYEI